MFLSINYKFFDVTPFYFINKLKEYNKNNIINGLEVSIDFNNINEINYLKELCNIVKNDNLIINMHGDSTLDLEKQKEYLDYINELSIILDKQISIVIHSINYFNNLLNYIKDNNYNIELTIENIITSNINDIKEELINNNSLKFTYDLGHIIYEHKKLIELDEFLLSRLVNTHIHDFNFIEDHQVINNNSSDLSLSTIKYLKRIKYNNSIVMEYDFYKLGNSFDERLENYVKSAIYVHDLWYN